LGINFFGLGIRFILGIKLGIKQAKSPVFIGLPSSPNRPYLLDLETPDGLAMQKVESSSLFSRLIEAPANRGGFVVSAAEQ
jgi:hypothetical protein